MACIENEISSFYVNLSPMNIGDAFQQLHLKRKLFRVDFQDNYLSID